MTKTNLARLIILILIFLFFVLYFMQVSGYNEYSKNRENMLTEEEINEMTKPKSKSFVSSEWDEIESMFSELNSIIKNEDYGRE